MADEELGRRVSSQKHRRLVQRGDTPLSLFMRKDTYELSVDRLHEYHISEVTKIAVSYDDNRNRTFYGWAVVSQDVAAGSGRNIRPSPKAGNDYHADIILPAIVVSDKREREKHASELAAKARWQAPV